MKTTPYVVTGVALLALLAAAAWWWQRSAPAPAETASAPAAVIDAPAPPPQPPAIAHLIEAEPASAPTGAAAPDLASALNALFGRKAILSLFQMDDFARRVVATVDNLGRVHASSRLWPLNPTAGRFTVEPPDGAGTISADNGRRYTPHVALFEATDLAALVAVYVQFYPQFQQAYVDLGYPKAYFNDRLVEVIDLLLAAPVPAGPVAVRRPTATSPVQPTRPWVLYEFQDLALERLTAGQKILVRMGPVNHRRVKARLQELRRLVATGKGVR